MATLSPAPAYRVLARSYRPTRLSELIGQDALVKTLSNAFTSGRIAHAFLLTGIRGVGKTTTARIIARGLNCTGPDGKGGPTPEPCGVCPSCRAIEEDRAIDVIEADAASNTGKDDVTELLSGIAFVPSSARFKVYILDEVHMLSDKAWAALLKTVEEPPPHAKFVFATTEVRKVPVTVLSRCQRFDLRRVQPEVLEAHLAKVAEREGISVEPEALALIVRAAEGSVRDSLSLLDQAIALATGPVDASHVRAMLGLADRARVLELLGLLLDHEPARALDLAQELWALGADPVQIVQDLLGTVHWLSRLAVAPAAPAPFYVGTSERASGEALLARHDAAHLARAWQVLLKGLGELREAPDAEAALEMLLIRLACLADLPPPAELARLLGASSRSSGSTGPRAAGATAPRLVPQAQAAPRTGSVAAAATAQAGPRSEATARPEPVASAPITALAQIIQRLREGGEPALAAHLESFAELSRLEPPLIEIRLRPGAPADLAGRLGAALKQLTGERWVVALGRGPAVQTLAEQQRAWRERRLAELAAEPGLQRLLALFPGARIVDVVPPGPGSGEAPAERKDGG